MSISRRKFLGWLGAAGFGTALGNTARAASNKHFDGYPNSNGVLFDNTRCIGCRKCEEGCNRVNELPEPERPFSDLSLLDTKRRTTAKSYTVVNRYDDAASEKARCTVNSSATIVLSRPVPPHVLCGHLPKPKPVRLFTMHRFVWAAAIV